MQPIHEDKPRTLSKTIRLSTGTLPWVIGAMLLVACGDESDRDFECNEETLLADLTFEDPNLDRCIAESKAKSVGDLSALECPGYSIKSVAGIEKLDCLANLELYYNGISDISALGSLTNLRTLGLSENNVSDISALGSLTNLVALDLALSNANLRDVSALANLTKLTFLHLGGNKVSDVSALKSLTNLRRLEAFHNDIKDSVAELAALVNAEEIDLRSNATIPCADLVKLQTALPGVVEPATASSGTDCTEATALRALSAAK